MVSVDISQGKDPILGSYDIVKGLYSFRVDGVTYEFLVEKLPFTMKEMKYKGRTYTTWADKDLVLKHGRH